MYTWKKPSQKFIIFLFLKVFKKMLIKEDDKRSQIFATVTLYCHIVLPRKLPVQLPYRAVFKHSAIINHLAMHSPSAVCSFILLLHSSNRHIFPSVEEKHPFWTNKKKQSKRKNAATFFGKQQPPWAFFFAASNINIYLCFVVPSLFLSGDPFWRGP